MPAEYESMRDKFMTTMPAKAAKKKAAMIFNANRKPGEKPVTRYRDAFARAAQRNSERSK